MTTTDRAARRGVTLGDAAREFLRHPTPWMILAFLAGTVATLVWTLADLVSR